MAFTVWLTGVPASGKTTLAWRLRYQLDVCGIRPIVVLDGDEMRSLVCADLGFGREDRRKQAERLSGVAKILNDQGVSVIVAAVSPYREDRAAARDLIKNFLEVGLWAPPEVCEQRDPKGLYARQRAQHMKGLTGVDAPYEPPENSPPLLDTSSMDVEACVQALRERIWGAGIE